MAASSNSSTSSALLADVLKLTCTVPPPSIPSPNSSPWAEPGEGGKPPIWLRYLPSGLNLSITPWPASITYRSPAEGSDGLLELSTAIAAGLPCSEGNENDPAGVAAPLSAFEPSAAK